MLRLMTRAYHLTTLNETYQQSVSKGFQGSKTEWKSMRGRKMTNDNRRNKYEDAVAHGYTGSFKEWFLAADTTILNLRITGRKVKIRSSRRALKC